MADVIPNKSFPCIVSNIYTTAIEIRLIKNPENVNAIRDNLWTLILPLPKGKINYLLGWYRGRRKMKHTIPSYLIARWVELFRYE